ncbi:MAG: PD-(D/E)XK nuclease family protein, partial [Gammaproteobacteria bacterium]|nr:PD-(D/E)XK nuclease family protein [Gammaproteobacteria bacterium]
CGARRHRIVRRPDQRRAAVGQRLAEARARLRRVRLPVDVEQRAGQQLGAALVDGRHQHLDFAGLFSTWFESPFFAFCVYRLGIHELSAAPRGLSAAAQGQVLHRALQTLWGELGDSAALAVCTPAALGAAIDAALRPALAQAFPQAELGRALVALEHARMADLLRQWLAHERRRAEPFAVHLREAKLDTELAGLPLRLRVDRVDRVSGSAGDRYLILDYKTGAQADPKGWETDHFRDPQLPLYATLGQVLGLPRVDGIGFAHLKDGHPALSPACSWTESLLEAGHPPRRDWQPRLREWNDRLRAIAAAFMAGDARFDAAALPSPLHHQALLELTGAAAAAADA